MNRPSLGWAACAAALLVPLAARAEVMDKETPPGTRGAAVTEVLASLSEAVAWCAARADVHHPGTSVRSAELMPPLFALTPETRLDRLLASPEAASEAVRLIAQRRREALGRAGISPAPLGTLAGGRVFGTDFNTDICGVAARLSGGFFDGFDVPGWDTWFAHEPTGRFGGTVYGWVPAELAPWVERGFSAVPVRSVWWVEESNIRRLLGRVRSP